MREQAIPVHSVRKTQEDFLRWLRTRNALNKQAAEEQNNQAHRACLQAMMIWADDGGRVSETIEDDIGQLGE